MSDSNASPMLDCFGRTLFPLDFNPDEIHIEEVAHSLSKICRFNGRYRGAPYSVAEHSLNVLILLERETNNPLVQLVGLLHDAHEMLLGDISSPWYPLLIFRQDNVQMPLRKFADILQQRVLRALIPSCALPTYQEMRKEIFLIVADADLQVLLWEKDHILFSNLPWPGQDQSSPPTSVGGQRGDLEFVNWRGNHLGCAQDFLGRYARLFQAVESAYGSPASSLPPFDGGIQGGSSVPDHANGFSGS